MSARKNVATQVTEIAVSIRRDARTLRRALEIGDTKNAYQLTVHLIALADELAPEPSPLVL